MADLDLEERVATDPETRDRQTSLIARQSIVDAKHNVVAYELFNRSSAHQNHDASTDVLLIFSALCDTVNALNVKCKTLFINRTHQSLLDGHMELVPSANVVIEVGPVAGHSAEGIERLQGALCELRTKGFRLAFTHTVVAPAYASWQALADYVKVDLQVVKPEMLKPLIAAIHARTPAQIVAEKVETEEQFTAVAELGVSLFQGYWLGQPKVFKTEVVAPAQAIVLQLFSLLRKKADIEEIENLFKRDALLGFNLLRLINSAGFGLTKEVTSFRHAVMLLGMSKLYRWTALLLATSRANVCLPVIGSTAVVRGRMMELLGAGTLSAEECDGAFVVGIFSMLDEMLRIPMDKALELLDLQPAIHDALVHGKGTLGRMLALTRAAEANDDQAFASAAIALNFTDRHVNMAHLEALVWADSF